MRQLLTHLRTQKHTTMAQEERSMQGLGEGIGCVLERVNSTDLDYTLSPLASNIGLPQTIVLRRRMID